MELDRHPHPVFRLKFQRKRLYSPCTPYRLPVSLGGILPIPYCLNNRPVSHGCAILILVGLTRCVKTVTKMHLSKHITRRKNSSTMNAFINTNPRVRPTHHTWEWGFTSPISHPNLLKIYGSIWYQYFGMITSTTSPCSPLFRATNPT